MTINIEKEFFKVFEIEPEITYVCDKSSCKKGLLKTCADIKCSHLYDTREDYPEITTEKLLQMICIILNAEGLLTINTEGSIEDIKDFVLRFLIGKVNKNNPYCHYKTKNKIKHQIQQLFERRINKINNIDVSECNAYKNKHCKNETSIMFTEYNLCSNFPNCNFKQLKRLEQRIEANQLLENETNLLNEKEI